MNTGKRQHDLPELLLDAKEIVTVALQHKRRVLLFGPMGAGKSTLAAQLADTLCETGLACYCLNADPGSPAFGVPGSVSLAAWIDQRWDMIDSAALCTLNAGRFRLPLISAVRRLSRQIPSGLALIDAPGVVRGIAGRELLHGLVEAAAIDVVLALSVQNRPPPLLEELHSLAVDVFVLPAARSAKRPGKRIRARQRTEQWDKLLQTAHLQQLDLDTLNIIGTPPLPDEASAWKGKQIALLRAGQTLGMGEVQRIDRAVLSPMTSFLAEQLATAHWFDQRETRRALQWEPAVSLDEGFARLADWFSHGTGPESH